jgi:hypothetical protein
MLLTCQKKSAWGQDTVASPNTRVSKDFRTHAKEPISLLESLQKASEWAQSHVIISYDKCGSLGGVGAIVKNALCDYLVMLVCSSCVEFWANTSGNPSEGFTRGTDNFWLWASIKKLFGVVKLQEARSYASPVQNIMSCGRSFDSCIARYVFF